MWRGAGHPESLEPEEWLRFFLICGSIVRPIELAYLDYAAGRPLGWSRADRYLLVLKTGC